jgi:hypothetical protein
MSEVVRYYLLYSLVNQAWLIMLGTGDLDRDFVVGIENDKEIAEQRLQELPGGNRYDGKHYTL